MTRAVGEDRSTNAAKRSKRAQKTAECILMPETSALSVLDGRVAIVIGAAGGLGHAIRHVFEQEDAADVVELQVEGVFRADAGMDDANAVVPVDRGLLAC